MTRTSLDDALWASLMLTMPHIPSRGGLCSKLHVCADGAGRILRLLPSPGQHSDLRRAPALVSSRKSPCDSAGVPARDAALDRGYVSARPRAAFAADGCAVHTPPKLGMVDPPPWDRAIYAANASRFGEPGATTSRTRSPSWKTGAASRSGATRRAGAGWASPTLSPPLSTSASQSSVTDPSRTIGATSVPRKPYRGGPGINLSLGSSHPVCPGSIQSAATRNGTRRSQARDPAQQRAARRNAPG